MEANYLPIHEAIHRRVRRRIHFYIFLGVAAEWRAPQGSGRDGDRRGNGRRDLQTGPAAHGLTTTHLWANWTLSAGRSTFG